MSIQKSRKLRLCQLQLRINKAAILNLEGLWIQEFGFDIGDLVQITPGEEELTIKTI